MTVAHREQYFAFGGGGMGPTAPGTVGTAYGPTGAYAGALRGGTTAEGWVNTGGDVTPGEGVGAPSGLAPAGTSVCGRV